MRLRAEEGSPVGPTGLHGGAQFFRTPGSTVNFRVPTSAPESRHQGCLHLLISPFPAGCRQAPPRRQITVRPIASFPTPGYGSIPPAGPGWRGWAQSQTGDRGLGRRRVPAETPSLVFPSHASRPDPAASVPGERAVLPWQRRGRRTWGRAVAGPRAGRGRVPGEAAHARAASARLAPPRSMLPPLDQ